MRGLTALRVDLASERSRPRSSCTSRTPRLAPIRPQTQLRPRRSVVDRCAERLFHHLDGSQAGRLALPSSTRRRSVRRQDRRPDCRVGRQANVPPSRGTISPHASAEAATSSQTATRSLLLIYKGASCSGVRTMIHRSHCSAEKTLLLLSATPNSEGTHAEGSHASRPLSNLADIRSGRQPPCNPQCASKSGRR